MRLSRERTVKELATRVEVNLIKEDNPTLKDLWEEIN